MKLLLRNCSSKNLLQLPYLKNAAIVHIKLHKKFVEGGNISIDGLDGFEQFVTYSALHRLRLG